jgi:hypothetical protein
VNVYKRNDGEDIMYKKNLTQGYIKFVIKQKIFTGAEEITVIMQE